MSGRILSKLRASLTADHVNELTCLNKWLHEEMDEKEGNSISNVTAKRARVAERFTTLSLQLEHVAGESSEEEEDDDEE